MQGIAIAHQVWSGIPNITFKDPQRFWDTLLKSQGRFGVAFSGTHPQTGNATSQAFQQPLAGRRGGARLYGERANASACARDFTGKSRT